MDAATPITRELRLGRVTVRLRFAGPALLPLAASLSQLTAGGRSGPEPSLAIDLWDADSTGVLPPPFPRTPGGAPARGEIRHDREAGVLISFASGVRERDGAFTAMTAYDERAAVARCFVSHPGHLPAHEWAAPLRAALQWGLNRPDHLLVHAGAAGIGGRGALLTGPSGSGKSTAAVASLLAGCDCLGDDYVFLDLGGPQPIAHSLYTTAKLTRHALELLPDLEHHPALRAARGHDKRILDLTLLGPQALRRPLPIAAIVVPDIEPARCGRLDRLSPGAALLALAPTTVLHAPRRDAAELGPLAKLVRSVPAYRLAIGSGEPIGVVAPMLARLLDTVAPTG